MRRFTETPFVWAADISPRTGRRDSLCSQAGALFREAKFDEAEAAYSASLQADPRDVEAHLGLGKIARLRSDEARTRLHYSRAYQLDPSSPDAILAFASVVEDRDSRKILLRNFLALTKHDRSRDVEAMDKLARLRVGEQLGDRNGSTPHRCR